MRFGVLQFPGSCDERDAVLACGGSATPSSIWHEETDLGGIDAVVVPGGFSYGDYLRAGAIARFAPAMEAVARVRRRRAARCWGSATASRCSARPGCCPGALLPNEGLRFLCRQVELEVVNARRRRPRTARPGERLSIPVKHMSGRWFAPAEHARRARGRRPDRLPLRARAEPQRLDRRRRRRLQRAPATSSG